jgi:serine/threonine protein kinase
MYARYNLPLTKVIWGDVLLQVVVPLLRVLHHLHQLGILHRDIKPENIFFAEDGSLQLGDFGLALSSQEAQPVSRVGTLEYIAPEVSTQRRPELTPASNTALPAHAHPAPACSCTWPEQHSSVAALQD